MPACIIVRGVGVRHVTAKVARKSTFLGSFLRSFLARRWAAGQIVKEQLEEKTNLEAYFYLLILDLSKRSLNVKSFRQDEAFASQEAYDKAEKDADADPNTQVVLVSVDDLNSLRKAYPNYYVDTQDFMTAFDAEMQGARHANE